MCTWVKKKKVGDELEIVGSLYHCLLALCRTMVRDKTEKYAEARS